MIAIKHKTTHYFQRVKNFLLITFLIFCVVSLAGCQQIMAGMLNPKGVITYEERQLFFDCLALMLIVVLPVFIMSFAFIARYRATHPTSDYKPNWSHSLLLEIVWWGVPCAIIIVLGIMTWISSHKLDPYRQIDTPGQPMLIQAIALPWKWLFIYPEQHIATINFIEIDKEKQVEFWLTNDNVPMSAFFIPQLGSQIYTMAGMRTRLHILPTAVGAYEGLNTQYNGDGFSDMHFRVKVVEPDELQQWITQVKQVPQKLTDSTYEGLIQPSIASPVQYFSSVNPDLFKQIIMKYKQTEIIPTHWNYHPSH